MRSTPVTFALLPLALVSSVASFRQPDYRHIECGETISVAEMVRLPWRVDCHFTIEVPAGKTVMMKLRHKRNKPIKCNKITVTDAHSGQEYNLCQPFNGTSSEYIVRFSNLKQRLLLDIDYTQNTFICPGLHSVPESDVPFTVSTLTVGAGSNCTMILSQFGYLKLKLKRSRNSKLSSEDKCVHTAQVSQGTHLMKMEMDSPSACLSDTEEAEFALICGVSAVIISGPSVDIEAKISPLSKEEERALAPFKEKCK